MTEGIFPKADGEILYASEINQLRSNVFGDGSDGALSVASGTTTLTGGSIYNYTSINVANGAVLTVTAGATGPLIMKCIGNCTIDGTINLKGLSSYTGGAAVVANNTNAAGLAGNGWSTYVLSGAAACGIADGGSGGASGINDGVGVYKGFKAVAFIRQSPSSIWNGSGGGSGGCQALSVSATSGTGGTGGVGLILLVSGNLTITGTIDVSGGNGGNASASGGSGGGGGGGGAGSALIVYGGTLANSGTITVTGGTGGTKAGGFNQDGTAGGAGYYSLISEEDLL
jgi:hypothetical protein